jgi:hypothetical protein
MWVNKAPLPRQFSVTLSSSVREEIKDSIRWLHRNVGRGHEIGGYLFGIQRPYEWWDHLTVCLAATPEGSRTWNSETANHFEFGARPVEVLQRAPAYLQHLKHVGDWHVHSTPGSTVPSDRDAQSWALEMDTGALYRYVGVIVSPSESELGWSSPVISVWTVRREGLPSRPICEPARLDY